MQDVAIPDFMPQLMAGTSSEPQRGGCLVQVASWLNDGSWTDDVNDCGVHGLFRRPAISVNDAVDDEHRRLLAPLAASIAGTAGWEIDLNKADLRRHLERMHETTGRLQLMWVYKHNAESLGAEFPQSVLTGMRATYAELCRIAVARLRQLVEAGRAAAGAAHLHVEVPDATWRELEALMAQNCDEKVDA